MSLSMLNGTAPIAGNTMYLIHVMTEIDLSPIIVVGESMTKMLLCKLLGHKPAVTLFEKDNEECDCGADHTYQGCPRCRENLESWDDESG
jgi:hypothetical protein